MDKFIYILVSAAKNEAAFIEKTIQSVIAQRVLPQKWLIVSDGSTDQTEEIVSQYAAKYGFIELLRTDAGEQRNFGSKARAITAGYARVKNIFHDYVGILDADVSFDSAYYESVMKKFEQNPTLGIGGGIIFDHLKGKYIQQKTSTNWSVSGAIQMFRRECFVEIGGYSALRGGVDAVAEVMARMKGWEVRAFPEIHVFHHRPTGAEKGSIWIIWFNLGVEDYLLGYHFVFVLARCIQRSIERPYLLGSLLMLCGYCWSWIHRTKRQVSVDFIRHLRKEQMRRLKSWLFPVGVHK